MGDYARFPGDRPHGYEALVPGSAAVLPPGPYMLFVNKRTAKGLVPSAARQLRLD